MSRRFSQGSQQLHDLHGNGHYVYMERDNSSNNGSAAGGWRRRRRRRRKRRKKRNAVQPILGPVLSGMGFGRSKSGGVGGGGGGGVRRGSESSILSKASAQGIRMHVENQAFRLGGSLSSLAGGGGGGGSERMPMGATASGSDLGKGGGGHHLHPNHLHHSRSRRRKLPRLAPLSKQRHRSLSSSRSSLSLGMSVGGMAAGLQGFPQSHFAQNPYAQLYGGYDYDYAQFYASLGYPPPMAYPFWQPYPYPHPQFGPPLPPHPPPLPPHGAGPTTDFSIFAANGSLPGNSSSPEGERKRVVTASTSRRSEVTIETQQTELISLQKVTSGSEFKKPSLPVSDDSIEDLNSSQLDDSGAEDNDNDDDDGDSTAEAEVEV